MGAEGVARRIARGMGWVAACLGVVIAYLGVNVAAILLTEPLCIVLGRATSSALGMDVVAAADLYLSLFVQLLSLLTFALWWRRLRPCSFLSARCGACSASAGAWARRVAGIVLVGVAVQLLIAIALSLVWLFVPEVIDGYSELMEDSGSTSFNILSVAVVALGAPVVEELTCRGVMMEFALRAVCPEWRPRWLRKKKRPASPMPAAAPESGDAATASSKDGQEGAVAEPVSSAPALGAAATSRAAALEPSRPAPSVPVSWRRFAAAATIQAAIFALLHGNLVQSSYAFVVGLLFAVVVWRTGSLADGMILHAAINLSSYFVSDFVALLSMVAEALVFVVPVISLVVGFRLFWDATAPRTHRGADDASSTLG